MGINQLVLTRLGRGLDSLLGLVSGGLAVLAIVLLGVWGTDAEVRMAWPGLAAMAGWFLVLFWRQYRLGSIGLSAWSCWVAVLLAGGYFAWRISSSFSTQGAGSDALLMVLIGLAWGIGSLSSWRSWDLWAPLLGVFILLVLHLVAGLMLWHPLGELGSRFEPRVDNINRVRGLYAHYIFFGNFIASCGLGAVALALWGKGGWRHWGSWVAGVVGLVCLVAAGLTESRGTILVVALVLPLLLAGRFLSWRLLPVWGRLPLFLLMLGLPILLYPVVMERWEGGGAMGEFVEGQENLRVEETLRGEDNRVRVWRGVLQGWRYHEWLGRGSQATDLAYNRYWVEELPSWFGRAQFAHSEYFQLLYDYGSFGLLISLGAVMVILVNGLGGVARAWVFAAVGLALVLVMLVHVSTDFPVHIPANAALFGLGLGLLSRKWREFGGLSGGGFREADMVEEQDAFGGLRVGRGRAFGLVQGVPFVLLAVGVLIVGWRQVPASLAWAEASRAEFVAEQEQNYGEQAAGLYEKFDLIKHLQRNESDWLLMARLAQEAAREEKDLEQQREWNWRCLACLRQATAANAYDVDALLFHVHQAQRLGQLDEAREQALRGWREYASRTKFYPWHLYLAEIELRFAERELVTGGSEDKSERVRKRALEAQAWLGLGGRGIHHIQPEFRQRYGQLEQNIESLLKKTGF